MPGDPPAPHAPLHAPSRCEMCGRAESHLTRHHLIPRKTHRRPRIRRRFDREELHRRIAMLCRACHKTVHATLSERELAESYHTIQALREHPELAKFIAWVRRQPPGRRIAVRRGKRG